jgi:hypothetical protein
MLRSPSFCTFKFRAAPDTSKGSQAPSAGAIRTTHGRVVALLRPAKAFLFSSRALERRVLYQMALQRRYNQSCHLQWTEPVHELEQFLGTLRMCSPALRIEEARHTCKILHAITSSVLLPELARMDESTQSRA